MHCVLYMKHDNFYYLKYFIYLFLKKKRMNEKDWRTKECIHNNIIVTTNRKEN